MKVRICPTFDSYHNSSLLQAIVALFGVSNVRYTCQGFPALDARSLAFVVEPLELKICLDHIDIPRTIERGLEWCDVYGKSNVDPATVPPAHAAKVLITGSCIPFRVCGPRRGLLTAAWTYALCLPDFKRIKSPREHFANWWRQYKYRLSQPTYVPASYTPGYVFFSATIWKSEPECNRFRANFMEACRTTPGLRFEGGFMPRPRNDVPGFERYTTDHKRSHGEYVANTKRSTVAFNTPSVFGCNPWRLAEFLAMGKAMISTPLIRELPAPLTHGENVHFVDGSLESIREAVRLLLQDAEYRQHLERGARTYYLSYLKPERIIQRILAFAAQQKNLDPSTLPLGDEAEASALLEPVAASGA